MTTPEHDHPPHNPHAEGTDLAPDAISRDPRALARDQFIHGVLGFLHHDDPRTQTRRVAGVMGAIDDERAEYAERAQRARMTIHSRPVWRVASGLAAAAAVGVAVFLTIPTAPAVATLIDSSLAAAKQGIDRRYEVRVSIPAPPQTDGTPSARAAPAPAFIVGEPIATIDTRGDNRMVARATTPRGERVAFGRDDKGDWNLAPGGGGGGVERVGASARRPSWLDFGESTIMMESMDLALERLKDEYDAKRVERAPLPAPATGTEPLDRLSATLKVRNGASPERLELWINPTTRLVERLEMHWAPRPRPEGGMHRDGREGREGRDGRGPRDGGRPGGGGPGGPEGMPPGGGGPGGGGGPPPPRGPRGPDGPGPRDGAAMPDGPRPAPFMGPHQGPPPRERRPNGGPRPMHGPPDFARHAPPPRVMIITRIDVQPVSDDWFSPDAHAEWAAQTPANKAPAGPPASPAPAGH